MSDSQKTNTQLREEINQLRQRVAEFEMTEVTLRESEERWQFALEGSQDGVWDWNAVTNEVFFSGRWKEMLGYTEAEITNNLNEWDKRVHPDDKEQCYADLNKHLNGETPYYENEHRVLCKDGSYKWVLDRGKVVSWTEDKKPLRVIGTHTDITARKQAEAMLRASEAKYRQLYTTMSEGSGLYELIYDESGRAVDYWILDVNPAYEAVTGWPRDQVVGRRATEVLEPKKLATYEEVVATGKPATFEVHFPELGKYLHASVFPVEGKRFATVFTDITEHRQAEEALRESEERYRIITELMSDFAFSYRVEPQGTIVPEWFTIDSVTRLTGYTREDIEAQETYFLYHPDDVSLGHQHIQAVLRGQVVTGEYRIYTKQGQMRWLRAYRQPVWDEQENRVVRFYGVSQDITERKLAEEKLRASEEQYRALFERTNDGIFLINLDDTIREVNQQAADMLGYSIEEMIGRPTTDFVVPDERQESRLRGEALLAGKTLPVYERTLLRKNGTTFPAEINIALALTANGQPSHKHSVVRDLTERKQTERRRLELAVERERRQILSNFITQASHEFRTPLTTINSSAYLLRKTLNTSAHERYIQKIEDRVEDITTLVEALTTMSRLDGIHDLTPEAVDLCELVEKVYTTMQKAFQAKHIQSAVQSTASPLIVQGDKDDLRQAMARLVDNAIRFTPEEGRITIRLDASDGKAVIEITDTGEGISDTDFPHIFESFYRADKSGTTRGFGLGLPIVQRIIELHQGNLEVESVTGKGSTFRIELPIQ